MCTAGCCSDQYGRSTGPKLHDPEGTYVYVRIHRFECEPTFGAQRATSYYRQMVLLQQIWMPRVLMDDLYREQFPSHPSQEGTSEEFTNQNVDLF